MAYKCNKCGVESEVEQAFTKVGIGPDYDYYCPTCQQKRNAEQFKVSIIWYFLAGLLGFAIWMLKPDQPSGKILLAVFSFIFFLYPLIIIHELAHAITARVLGLRVFAIQMGYGKVLFNTYLGKVAVVLRSLPLGGLTYISAPRLPFYHLRFGLTYLAGPFIHLAILLGMCPLWLKIGGVSGAAHSPVYLLLTNWLISNLVVLVANLIPRRVDTSYGPIRSDGGQILNALFHKPGNMEERLARYYATEAAEAARQDRQEEARQWIEQGLAQYPTDPLILNTAGYVFFQAGQWERARQVWLAQLADAENLKPEIKFMALNNIAFANLLINDPALLDEADRYSTEAHKNMPWMAPIRGTRGAVLIELNQPEVGLELLRSSLEKTDTPKDKAYTMSCIAIGEARLGNQADAQRFVRAARLLDPQCPFLERAAREAGMDSIQGGKE